MSETQMYTGGQGNHPRPPKKNNGVLAALIVIAVLLVIVVALLVVYLVKDKAPAPKEVQNTEVVETKTVNVDTASATAAPVEQPKAPEPPAMAEEMSRPLEGNYSLNGSVGKYGVVMQLNIDGNYISGKYRYTRMKGAGGWLTISGERSGGERQGQLYISEYNDMGENCGNWSGTYHLKGNKLSISGSMVNYKGTTYSFNLNGK